VCAVFGYNNFKNCAVLTSKKCAVLSCILSQVCGFKSPVQTSVRTSNTGGSSFWAESEAAIPRPGHGRSTYTDAQFEIMPNLKTCFNQPFQPSPPPTNLCYTSCRQPSSLERRNSKFGTWQPNSLQTWLARARSDWNAIRWKTRNPSSDGWDVRCSIRPRL